MSKKYFGTDGIRGRVGEFPITPDFMLKLGWALGKVLGKEPNSKIVIGKDTRISGYMFESALEAGLAAAGVNIQLLGPLPTPGIAYITRTQRAQAGIVISASHNPFYDNGIKFFCDQGSKLPDDIEHEIEAYLEKPLEVVPSDQLGKAKRIVDAAGRYVEFCKQSIPADIHLLGFHLVLDCANGATYQVAPKVFTELGASIKEVSNHPDGLNINEHCGSTHIETLQTSVKAEANHSVGIAFDGDGDRVLMVDEQGELVDGDDILFIIAKHMQAKGLLKGGVVGTLMSNFGLELAFKELNIPFLRAQVGDRYVMALLKEQGWQLGGETSGHIVYLPATTTGDGIISALQVLAAMQETGKTLHELKQGLQKLPQVMINVRVEKRFEPMKQASIVSAVEEIQARLSDRGRVLLRASGTEPLIRVMVEGEDQVLVTEYASSLARVVKEFHLVN